MSDSSARFLVTGAYGCIGAWVVRELLAAELPVVTFDLSTDARRLRALLEPAALAAVPHVVGDISELDAVERAVDEHGITNVVHLAALQVPFCRAEPALGARVNVLGTVNVFEAVKRRRGRMAPVVYASSVAAYDALEADADGKPPQMSGHPATLYGVYKRANEGTAGVYWQDDRVASIGIRPHTVYGVGRDQGMTSAPTVAMLAAAAGVPYRIPYGGRSQLQFGRDVGRAFIAASLVPFEGAAVHNLPGRTVSMEEVVAAIVAAAPQAAGVISFDPPPLPFPEAVDGESLAAIPGAWVETPLEEGVRATVERFRELLAAGLVTPPAP